MSPRSIDGPASVVERLGELYRSPGPYLSVYVDADELAAGAVPTFDRHAQPLIDAGATPVMIETGLAGLAAPLEPDTGGRSLHVAADGTSLRDDGPEGFAHPVFRVDQLPMVGPLLERDQWRVPHLAVTIDAWVREIVEFPVGRQPQAMLGGNDNEILEQCRQLAIEGGHRLITIRGEHRAAIDLHDRLAAMVPVTTQVAVIGTGSTVSDEEYSEAVVRQVADVVARDTVHALQDFRFARAGGESVDGVDATFTALREGRGRRLLVHDDPADTRMASFGSDPTDVSAAPTTHPFSARLVDVALWSAVCRGIDVRIVPSTGPNGPADGIGLMLEASGSPVR